MALPKSVTKIKKGGVEFTSSVDRISYTLKELQRAALRDTAKFIRKIVIAKMKKMPGMRKSKRPYKNVQYWLRRREGDLQIGMRHSTWYGVDGELGTKNQPARGFLRNTVMENVDTIRKIQGQYLSSIEDERKALSLIDESEGINQDGEND